MTLKALIAQARHLRSIIGEECVRAGTGAYERIVLLDLVTVYPPDSRGYREPEKGIVIECPWRLETQKEVIAGSGDNDSSIKGKIQVCVGKRVVEAEVYPPSYTARIRFEDDLTLWVFPDDPRDYVQDSEYPSSPWYLVGRAFPGGWEE